MFKCFIAGVLAVCTLFATAASACADSWELPKTQTFWSPNHRVRLTVTPRDLSSQLQYFEDKVADKSLAGQRPTGSHTSARGLLEKKSPHGTWSTIWDRELVNDVSPVSALVANSGRYVVTFDDWFSVGRGSNVVVIYRVDGSVVRSLSLSDILPDFYIKSLPRSVSSTGWGGEHRIRETTNELLLKIIVPNDDEAAPARNYVNFPIHLASGRVSSPPGSAWQKALIQAQHVAQIRQASEDAYEAAWIAPLLGPTTDREADWHYYLREAFFRSAVDWKEAAVATNVLRSPTARDYKPSEKWLCDALRQTDDPADVIMVASPASPQNLVKVLNECVNDVGQGSLKAARVYVAIPEEFRDKVAAALAPTGATIIFLDPTVPIPQRKERLR